LGASLKSGLDDLVLTNEKAMEAAERDTKQVAKDALWYSLSLLVFAILFTLVFSYILASKMSRPLTNLAQSLSNIKEGSGNYPRFEAYDKLSENKLMAERMKVIRAEEAKARFIADLSHQLKTPMTSLSMSIGILVEKAKGLIGEKYERLLETAKEDCSRLSSLISELVDIARYDAMPKPTTKEILRIEGIVRQCLKPLSIQAEEKGVNLEEEFDPTLPTIAIDPLKFPWVITNLVGNAIRYTDRGGRVTLRVKKHRNQCHFQCIDTGIGIEKK
jgi:signal transduction histidine kinase